MIFSLFVISVNPVLFDLDSEDFQRNKAFSLLNQYDHAQAKEHPCPRNHRIDNAGRVFLVCWYHTSSISHQCSERGTCTWMILKQKGSNIYLHRKILSIILLDLELLPCSPPPPPPPRPLWVCFFSSSLFMSCKIKHL